MVSTQNRGTQSAPLRELKAARQSHVMVAEAMHNAVRRIASGLGHGWLAEAVDPYCRTVRTWILGEELPSELEPPAANPPAWDCALGLPISRTMDPWRADVLPAPRLRGNFGCFDTRRFPGCRRAPVPLSNVPGIVVCSSNSVNLADRSRDALPKRCITLTLGELRTRNR
jgi:hypothetical protein